MKEILNDLIKIHFVKLFSCRISEVNNLHLMYVININKCLVLKFHFEFIRICNCEIFVQIDVYHSFIYLFTCIYILFFNYFHFSRVCRTFAPFYFNSLHVFIWSYIHIDSVYTHCTLHYCTIQKYSHGLSIILPLSFFFLFYFYFICFHSWQLGHNSHFLPLCSLSLFHVSRLHLKFKYFFFFCYFTYICAVKSERYVDFYAVWNFSVFI